MQRIFAADGAEEKFGTKILEGIAETIAKIDITFFKLLTIGLALVPTGDQLLSGLILAGVAPMTYSRLSLQVDGASKGSLRTNAKVGQRNYDRPRQCLSGVTTIAVNLRAYTKSPPDLILSNLQVNRFPLQRRVKTSQHVKIVSCDRVMFRVV